ncbi:FABP family protein [Corynebacterium urealyticum]|uniref:Ferric nitrobindin-like protein n=1 Tax=Corynebacterium urealyticum TaxID=43771 RepID=A0A5D4FYQ4_9CORY|nr:FABP family protein [Corynebacterium urealyticum]TYR20872.1 FABP family protein [Corynebacterium urealyticum]
MSSDKANNQSPDQGANTPAESTNSGPKLDGNEAVNLAAEQSKSTADKNLPVFGDLPIPEDTANLRFGPNLHDGLLALLPLVGVWRGRGQAAHPGEEEFTFGQQLSIFHDGENRLGFESRTWKINPPAAEGAEADGDEASAEAAGEPEVGELLRREAGFWRIDNDDNIELLIAHSDGMIELMYGKPLTERAWQLESASTLATETGPSALGPGKRLYGLMPNNDLGWVDERLIDGEMVPWMSAQLKRVRG